MRTDEEIRANQAKYERMLYEAFGLAPEQQPAGPAQTFSAGPMPSFPAYEDVYAALTGDPEAMAVFREGWDDTMRTVDTGPLPRDAFGQLRWYILRDLSRHHHERHKADFEDAKKYRTARRVNALFARLEKHDPLFRLTKDMMGYYLERLPASAQRAVERMFTRCPHEALEFYREIREAAQEAVKCNHARCNREKRA